MKLTRIHIKNFRACRDVELEIDRMHALVGSNNAGKSTVLRALDFLFNPSLKTLNEESFWNKDANLEIRVEAVFTNLTEKEKDSLGAYLKPDGTFHMARSAKMGSKSGSTDYDGEHGDDKIIIGQHYKKPIPKVDWLQESNITGANIAEWWKNKDELVVNGISFSEGLSKMPKVGEWRERAKAFVAANAGNIPFEDDWVDNPQGYAGVLKGTLPFFVLVPAVRDVTEESKGTKSSPFGKLLYAILDTVTEDRKAEIEGILAEVAKQMNRTGGEKRVPLIAETESKLNTFLKELFSECELEIEFTTPTLEVLLSSPKLYVDDGFKNAVENKGHGLQRAVIFSILRQYADHMTNSSEGKKRNLILAVEEPELYMHPQAQRTIRRVFRKISDGSDQVIFTTHSSLLVDVAYFDEIIRMESGIEVVDGKKTTRCKAWQLPMAKMIEDMEIRYPNLKVTDASMRDRYSHVYNPHRNEGFFASKVILVEGLTEEYSLPIYANAIPGCDFDEKNISVVECGGKGSMDRLYRIFNELHIPCYILFDYDSGNTDAEIVEESKKLLKWLGKAQDPPDSLLVDDTVACFRTNWETHLRPEIYEVEILTRKARQELGLKDKSGKPLIARYIARQNISSNPPYIPPSIKAIIEKAVAVPWNKSCLQCQVAQ